QLIEGQSLSAVIRQFRENERDKGTGSTQGPPGADRPEQSGLRAAMSDLRSTAVFAAFSTNAASHPRERYRKIARLMIQAADALEHAHRQGVIHRDVKPANLLVNAEGDLWITDFGLAQLQVDTGLTRSGDLLGTFRYMSPEQTSGQRAILDHRT